MAITRVMDLRPALDEQRSAFLADGFPDLAWRVERLKRIDAMVRKHQKRMVAAVQSDFGSRPAVQSRMEIMSIADTAKFAWKHVAGWMRRETASVPFPMRFVGGKAYIVRQPIGVAGIIGPWNYPYQPTLTPLVAAIAAGCRAMIKPSDMTPASGKALGEAIDEYFSPEEVVVATGDIELARAFSGLDFDHLLFTGSPGVARHVMRAAADTLTPVTLELGGKCPVVIDADARMPMAAERIMSGNGQNSGQICLCPDTVFVPENDLESFVEQAGRIVQKHFPTIRDNPDYTAIIDQRNYERLTGYVGEARAAGARVETLNPAGEDFSQQQHRKIPPTLVIDPDDTLSISREEIFGPLLVVRRYRSIDDVVAYINARPRPLALYYFGSNSATIERLQSKTTSGGVTINDVIMHASIENLPFGGVGNSGMGSYHGKFGFDTFSHAKAVYRQGFYSLMKLFSPPYTSKHDKLIDRQFPVPAVE